MKRLTLLVLAPGVAARADQPMPLTVLPPV
jgi:hypothetical protein